MISYENVKSAKAHRKHFYFVTIPVNLNFQFLDSYLLALSIVRTFRRFLWLKHG